MLCGSLRAVDGWAFPFHAENVLGGFAERKAEQAVTAVQVQEVVFLAEAEHAARRLDQVVNLALVNLAESRDGVAQAKVPEIQAKFAWAVELLEVEPFGGAFRFQVVVGFGRVHVGVRCGHVEGRFFQCVRNQLEFTHDARVNLLDVEDDHAVLVRAADDNPVERIGERLVRGCNEFFEQEVVNLVVLLGFEHGFLAVELEVPRSHGHAALARGAIGAGHGARDHLLRVAGEAVHVPEFLEGVVLDLQFVFVVEHGERFAVEGVCLLGVARNLVCDGLFEKHECLHVGSFYRGKFRKK